MEADQFQARLYLHVRMRVWRAPSTADWLLGRICSLCGFDSCTCTCTGNFCGYDASFGRMSTHRNRQHYQYFGLLQYVHIKHKSFNLQLPMVTLWGSWRVYFLQAQIFGSESASIGPAWKWDDGTWTKGREACGMGIPFSNSCLTPRFERDI